MVLPRSAYENEHSIIQAIRSGKHREFIGGLWEQMGNLQFLMLLSEGLKPEDYLIDVGCGAFRAGVKLIPYLDPSHYFGIDISNALMAAAYEREIEPLGLVFRFPHGNFATSSNFDLSFFSRTFTFGLAQSVFSHLPVRELTRCLRNIAPWFAPGARFMVTYFEVPEDKRELPFTQSPGGITTYADNNPLHYTQSEIREATEALQCWHLSILGEWGHPLGQRLLRFTRVPSASAR
ncbi:MAG TPA: class I SAM-dependent methyltransferase [Rhizomicrobium sp.]|jgi:SAM-dependent methyltransferase|nr:class I SAM-dependent methyltransferase [Rhizomicrobium sp.]